MARAQQRYLLGGEPESLDTARSNEWQRLHGLERAPRECQRVRITGGVEKTTAAIDDGHRSVVDTFYGSAAGCDSERNMRRECGVDKRHRQKAR